MEAASQHGRVFRVPVLRPLVRPFAFSGRATRTEALGFVLIAATAPPIARSIAGDGSSIVLTLLGLAWGLVWLAPQWALFVRRLHDQGRSGWWSLIQLALFAFAVILQFVPAEVYGSFRVEILIWQNRPLWTSWSAPLILGVTALIVVDLLLTLWTPTQGPNRYGPDPRGNA